MNRDIKAIIWDFDGTIGNTSEKNFNITRAIVERITGNSYDMFSVLRDFESYVLALRRVSDWIEIYTKDMGLTDEQTDEVVRLWAEYQLKDETPTPILGGVPEVVYALQKFSQGIVSENAQCNIRKVLEKNGLLKYFKCIVGYEEVDLRRKKPYPDGLIMCLEELTGLQPGHIIYIGDNVLDVKTVINANKYFEQNGYDIAVVPIITLHGSPFDDCKDWGFELKYVAEKPSEIIDAIQSFNPSCKMKGGVLVKG